MADKEKLIQYFMDTLEALDGKGIILEDPDLARESLEEQFANGCETLRKVVSETI